MAIMEPGADDYIEGGVHWNKTLEVLKKYSPESHRTVGDDAKIVIKSIKIVAESGASTYKAMVRAPPVMECRKGFACQRMQGLT